MRNIYYRLLLIAIIWEGLMLSGIAQSVYGHGTAAISLFTPDGIVVATDSNVTFSTGERRNWIEKPKLVVCNQDFLCTTSGIDPFLALTKVPPERIDYTFHKFIDAHDASHKHRTALKDYVDDLYSDLQSTFVGRESAMEDFFWDLPQAKTNPIIRWAIAGYTEGSPQACNIDLNLDLKSRKFSFVKTCEDVHFQSARSVRWFTLSGSDKAYMKVFQEKDVRALQQDPGDVAVETSFPGTSTVLKHWIRMLVAGTRLQGIDAPELIGGSTRIGVIVNGTTPKLALF